LHSETLNTSLILVLTVWPLRFLTVCLPDYIQWLTLGKTPLNEWSARSIDLYLTTHNTHKTETSMLPAGFEPAIPASGRRPNYALDRAAAGIGFRHIQTTITQLISLRLRYLTELETWSWLCSVKHAVYIATLVDFHEIFILFISLVFERVRKFHINFIESRVCSPMLGRRWTDWHSILRGKDSLMNSPTVSNLFASEWKFF